MKKGDKNKKCVKQKLKGASKEVKTLHAAREWLKNTTLEAQGKYILQMKKWKPDQMVLNGRVAEATNRKKTFQKTEDKSQ